MATALESLVYSKPVRGLVRQAGRGRARRIARWLRDVIPEGASVLDVGAGLGQVGHALRAAGHPVVTVDPRWHPVERGPHVRADGAALPFATASFDVALIAFVLHHVPADRHATIVQELGRVARSRVVLLEDTFMSSSGRLYTYAIDSLMNLEFFGHPHANRTSAGWLELLERLGLGPRLVWERVERWGVVVPLRHALLVGEKEDPV